MDMPQPERRPIAARRMRASVLLANWLIRKNASPNAISLAGMGCAMLAGGIFAASPTGTLPWLAAALLIQLRLLANMLDGMVAIGRGVASPLGEIFNEVPDRVADTAIFVGLGIAGEKPWLGLAASLAAMATAYVRAVGKGAGAPSDFGGPMAKQHRMAVATALCLWCALAPKNLGAPSSRAALWIILVLSSFTACRRLVRVARSLQAKSG